MNVLEKILEEIEETEDKYCHEENNPRFLQGVYSMAADIEEIIRSHMNEATTDWIPVSERLPKTSKMVFVTVHSSEWISDYYSDWVPEEEKIYHKEEHRAFCGYVNESGEWVFFDEEMSEVHCSEEFGTDKSVVYDVVTHWQSLPEPHKGESENDEM